MKKIIALGIVIFVLFAGYTFAWFWAAGQAADYVKALETADGVTTPRVTCDSFGIGGFPFGFDATCTKATIVSGDVTVAIAGLKASIEVYRPTHVLIFAQSPVSVDDAFTGSRSRLDFKDLQASVRLTGWRIGRISMVMDAPIWNDTVLDDRLLARAPARSPRRTDLHREPPRAPPVRYPASRRPADRERHRRGNREGDRAGSHAPPGSEVAGSGGTGHHGAPLGSNVLR